MRKVGKAIAAAVLSAAVGIGLMGGTAYAADHGDAPLVGGDQGCDIADVYFFRDPNDQSKVVLIATLRGFIASGENVNFGIFDRNVRHRFLIENTDDAAPDETIDVTFSQRVSTAEAQIATVRFSNGPTFTAPCTNSSIAPTAPDPVVSTRNGIEFFAGMTDDPFFFDIPAFNRFFASARAGAPDPSVLERGRDSFAGYNIMSIALRMPATMIRGDGDSVGASFITQRRMQRKQKNGQYRLSGKWQQIDRMGNPAVNVVLIPFNRKDAHNQGTPQQDAAGRFAEVILETLDVFGTDDTSRTALASVAIQKGDYLHLDLTVPNTGNGGGTNAAAAFPNGRRLGDDVVDILSTFINNRNALGDNADGNDVTFRNQFPFLAAPQQPRNSGRDDNTRN